VSGRQWNRFMSNGFGSAFTHRWNLIPCVGGMELPSTVLCLLTSRNRYKDYIVATVSRLG